MPPKKVTFPAFMKMEARVEVLESEISEVRSTLEKVQNIVTTNHANLIAMLKKCLGRTLSADDGDTSGSVRGSLVVTKKDESHSTVVNNLRGDALTEFRQSVKKVELPMFDGEDPTGWISRTEVYFRVQETSPEVKVNLAQLCMEGPTIHLFNSLLDEDDVLTWEVLKTALLERYGGNDDSDVYEQLSELHLKGTVEEYITDFEYLIAQIPKLSDKQFQGYFLHGLKSEIRGKVRSLMMVDGMTRSKLLQVSRAVEKEVRGEMGLSYNRASKSYGSGYKPNNSGAGRQRGSDWVFVKGAQERGTGYNEKNSVGPKRDRLGQNEGRRYGPRERGFSYLTYPQLLERKQKGLCFKCDGPFHHMHQCPNKQLMVLIVEEGGVEQGGRDILAVEVNEKEDSETDGEMSVMSLNNFITPSREQPQIVKFQGKIQGMPILILMDSGATHNFIDQRLIRRMG